MHKKILISSLLIIITLLTSCGSNSKKNVAQDFSFQEKKFIHNLFKTEYYWAEHTPDVDLTNYTNTDELINDLRYSSIDKWSMRITREQFENQFENKKDSGFGFRHTNTFRVFKTRIHSPSDKAGLKRGDIITHINNVAITPSLLLSAKNNLNTYASFTILRENNEKTIKIAPKEYDYNVSLSKIINDYGKNIGYLRFDSFLGNAVEELKVHFKTFVQNNIDELIIDLRYNGGGSISIASILLEHITKDYPNQQQMYQSWNENYSHKNGQYLFEDSDEHNGDELSMKKVYFLVTKNSASASEAVINALIPYLGKKNIVLVGSTTHGKAVGMSRKVYANNIYFLINFILKNKDDGVVPFSGIEITCPAEDDITHDFGDKKEAMLSTALKHIETGMCK